MEFGSAQLNTYRYILKNIYQYCHYIFFYAKNQGYLRYYFVFKREKTIPKLLSGIFFRYSEYYLLNNARREEIRMEERIIKTSVFFNDTLFNETAEQPMDPESEAEAREAPPPLRFRAAASTPSEGITARIFQKFSNAEPLRVFPRSP